MIYQLDICHFFPTSKICGSILVEQIFQGAIFAFDMNFFTEQTFSPQTPTNIRCAINRYLYLWRSTSEFDRVCVFVNWKVVFDLISGSIFKQSQPLCKLGIFLGAVNLVNMSSLNVGWVLGVTCICRFVTFFLKYFKASKAGEWYPLIWFPL